MLSVRAQSMANLHNINVCTNFSIDRDSSVGIATCYGVESLGIESRLGTRFSAPVQTGPGAHPASYKMCTWSFSGVNRPRRDIDRQPPSSAEFKETVQLYLYPHFGFSWPVVRRTFIFYIYVLRLHFTFTFTFCIYIYVLHFIFYIYLLRLHFTFTFTFCIYIYVLHFIFYIYVCIRFFNSAVAKSVINLQI
jgi:hypothetical protein